MHATAVDVVVFACRRASCALAALLFVALCAAAPVRADAARVLVLPVQADDAEHDTASTLSRSLETALGAVAQVEIITPAAVSATLDLEAQRQCLGDAAGEAGSCLSELADAVDVDFVARAQLGRLGSEYVFTLSLIDGDDAHVVSQGQRRADVDSPEALLDQMNGLAKEVASGADLATRAKKRRAVPGVPVAAALTGVGVAGVGVVALVVRGSLSGRYESGRLDASTTKLYDTVIDEPFLIGGVGAVVVGGLLAVGAGGYAVWTVLAPEE